MMMKMQLLTWGSAWHTYAPTKAKGEHPPDGFVYSQLKDHPTISKPTGPVMVCILDGFGFNTEDKWNGIHMAETPVYDSLRKVNQRFRSDFMERLFGYDHASVKSIFANYAAALGFQSMYHAHSQFQVTYCACSLGRVCQGESASRHDENYSLCCWFAQNCTRPWHGGRPPQ